MRWKHLLPFDHFVLEGPVPADEAAARLAAHTAFIRFGALRPKPHVFDGMVTVGRFDLTLWPEGGHGIWKSLQERDRDLSRPICRGRIWETSHGCQVEVTFRPRLRQFWLPVFFPVAGVTFIVRQLLNEPDTLAKIAVVVFVTIATSFMTVFFYTYETAAFWKMRDRTVAALVKVLREDEECNR